MNYEALRGIGEISLFREVEDKTYAGPCKSVKNSADSSNDPDV